MNVIKKTMGSHGIRISLERDHVEIGRVYLYVLHNDLHDQPFGLIEDLFVHEAFRRRGYVRALVRHAIESARMSGCYKLIATSRHGNTVIHKLSERFGFRAHGVEFRLDLAERKRSDLELRNYLAKGSGGE